MNDNRCPDCLGTGWYLDDRCSLCKGTGKFEWEEFDEPIIDGDAQPTTPKENLMFVLVGLAVAAIWWLIIKWAFL